MSSLTVTAIVVACLFPSAMLGMFLRSSLPEHHLGPESTDVIKLATGLMATLAALVLSLLISSAKNTHDITNSEYVAGLANYALLDRYLVDYGPDTGDIRAALRHALIRRLQTVWPDEDFGPAEPANAAGEAVVEGLEQRILALRPNGDAQSWYRSQALQMVSNIAQVRWLMSNQLTAGTLPTPLLVVLICWVSAIFISFGLFTRANGTVIFVLFVSALAVAGAVFLILELNSPFAGMIHISSAPARATLALLGQ